MKKIILLTGMLLIADNSVANTKNEYATCNDLSEMAGLLMEARVKGVEYGDVVKTLARSTDTVIEYLKISPYVKKAYDYPIAQKTKAEASEGFQKEVFFLCSGKLPIEDLIVSKKE